MSFLGRVTPGLGFAISGIVPLGDLSEENTGQRRRREVQLGFDPRDVVRGYVRAKHGGEVERLAATLLREFLELLVVHRPIAGTEVDGSLGGLFDAAARSNGLVVELNLGVILVVLVEPLRVDRVGECRASAGHQRLGGDRCARQNHRARYGQGSFDHRAQSFRLASWRWPHQSAANLTIEVGHSLAEAWVLGTDVAHLGCRRPSDAACSQERHRSVTKASAAPCVRANQRRGRRGMSASMRAMAAAPM